MATKKSKAATPGKTKRKEDGTLPNAAWLRKNGYGGLVAAMRRHPEAFAHIKQAGRA